MDHAHRRHPKGHPMSRYIATALLAIAAALITVAHLAFLADQPELSHAGFVLQP